MAKQSSHTRWKGCAMCKPYKFKDNGQPIRKTWSELKYLGRSRRISRHYLGDE